MDPELERFILGQVLQRFLGEHFGSEERAEIAGPQLEEIAGVREEGREGFAASKARESRTADELFMSRLAQSNANNPDLFPSINQVVIEPGEFVGRGTEANVRMNQPRIAPGERASFSDPEITEQLLQDLFFRAQRESRSNELGNQFFQARLASGKSNPFSATFETRERGEALAEQAGDVTLADLMGLLSAGAADVNLATRKSGSALMQLLRDINFQLDPRGEAVASREETDVFNRARAGGTGRTPERRDPEPAAESRSDPTEVRQLARRNTMNRTSSLHGDRMDVEGIIQALLEADRLAQELTGELGERREVDLSGVLGGRR